jgi:hypothetical protein
MLLGQVVRALEGMPDAERLRWLDLLSYVHALVYHEREEAAALQQVIEDSVQTDPHRQEVRTMRKSYATVLEERGRLRSRRETLLQAIRIRFGDPPPATAAAIETSEDIAQLDAWFKAVLTARRLAEVGIGAQG